jgi:branched-chain amino acid transport system permease protein
MFSILPQILVTGIAVGGVYALVASGLTVAYAVTRHINLMQAHFLMLSLYLVVLFQSIWGLDPYVSALLVVPILFGFGLLVFLTFMRGMLETNVMTMFQLFIGGLMVIENAVLMVFSTTPRQAESVITMQRIVLGNNIMLPLDQVIACLASVGIGVGGYFLLKSTEFGRCVRAVSNDAEAASLMGIKVARVQWMVFGFSFVLIAIAAVLIAPSQWVNPNLGGQYMIFTFIVITLGGFGNFVGALLAGFLLGILQTVCTAIIGTTIGLAIPYLFFVAVFLWRPRGLVE